jgi:predicted GNAT family acetyltransferase
MNSLEIHHDRAGSRFTSSVEGAQCLLDYRLSGSVMTITHTSVPEQLGGRGIAGQLMTAALDAARAEGWKVHPACSYALAFMAKHPEFEDLRQR